MAWSKRLLRLQPILIVNLLLLKTVAGQLTCAANTLVCTSCTSYGTCGGTDLFPTVEPTLCDPGWFCDPDLVTALAPCVETPPSICECSTSDVCIADPINTQNVIDSDGWAIPGVATDNVYLDCREGAYIDYKGTPVSCPTGTLFPMGEDGITPTADPDCKCDGTITDTLLCTSAEDGSDYYISPSNDGCEVYYECFPAAGDPSIYLFPTSCPASQCFELTDCACPEPPTTVATILCPDCGAYLVSPDDPLTYQKCKPLTGGTGLPYEDEQQCDIAFLKDVCMCGCDLEKCDQIAISDTEQLDDYFFCDLTTGVPIEDKPYTCPEGKNFDQDACGCTESQISTTSSSGTEIPCPECGFVVDDSDSTKYWACLIEPPREQNCLDGAFYVGGDTCDCLVCPSCGYAPGATPKEFYYCAEFELVGHKCPNEHFTFDEIACECQPGSEPTESPPVAPPTCYYTQNPTEPNCWIMNGSPAGCCPTTHIFNDDLTVCICEEITTTTPPTTATTLPTIGPCPDCGYLPNEATEKESDFIACLSDPMLYGDCTAPEIFDADKCACLPPS